MPCVNLFSVANPYVQRAYLTQAATCSQGASLELLLSGTASHYTMGYHYIKYQLSTGPIHPSSHDLPLSCPSPLSNQAPPHDLQRPSAGSATSSTVCVTLHHEQPPPLASRQCYTNVTPGYTKLSLRVTRVPNRLAMCLQLGWVRVPGTSLPMCWAQCAY